MNMIFFSRLKEIWRGKDLYRILMNEECAWQTIGGKVLDIGSGKNMASYRRFLKTEKDTTVESLDLALENYDGGKINLEKDFLPHETGSIDAVLLFNVLEHLFNYPLVLSEIRRVLKPGGALIGVVPFLVGYHPDPHDYWRFTRESLEKIFITAGFFDIKIKSFGRGPCSAAFAQTEVALPRALKIILLPIVLLLDRILKRFRSGLDSEKFPLGLFFTAINK